MSRPSHSSEPAHCESMATQSRRHGTRSIPACHSATPAPATQTLKAASGLPNPEHLGHPGPKTTAFAKPQTVPPERRLSAAKGGWGGKRWDFSLRVILQHTPSHPTHHRPQLLNHLTTLGPRDSTIGHELAAREHDRFMPVSGRPSHARR